MTEIPEPKDKLDGATEVVVSGPEDDALRWRQVDWRRAQSACVSSCEVTSKKISHFSSGESCRRFRGLPFSITSTS
jgi:hypothetical protein